MRSQTEKSKPSSNNSKKVHGATWQWWMIKMKSIHSTSSDQMFQKSYTDWRIFSSLYLSPVQSPDLLFSFTASINLHFALPLGLLPASSNLSSNNLSKTCNMPLSSLTSLSLIPSTLVTVTEKLSMLTSAASICLPSFPQRHRLRAVRHTFILVDALLSHVADTLLHPFQPARTRSFSSHVCFITIIHHTTEKLWCRGTNVNLSQKKSCLYFQLCI